MPKHVRLIGSVFLAITLFGGGVATANTMSAVSFTLVDNGDTEIYTTNKNTLEEFLQSKNMTLKDKDTSSKDLREELVEDEVIYITRGFFVELYIDNVPSQIKTYSKTVGDLLAEIQSEKITEKITYVPSHAKETDLIKNNMRIDLRSQQQVTVTEVEAIPFETEVVLNENLDEGIENVVTSGVDGQKEILFSETYQGDALIAKEMLQETVTLAPVTHVIEKGTAKTVATSAGNLKYSKAMDLTATGYSQFDPDCGRYTATGAVAEKGVVAVDPRVIPLGTKLYVEGYGYAVAADTGGAIKGNKIDLCFDTYAEASAYGRKKITVYILD